MGLMEPGVTAQRLQTDSEDWCNAYFVTSAAGRGGGDAMYMFSAPNEAKDASECPSGKAVQA